MQDDTELAMKAHLGDREAFAALVDRHKHGVYRTLWRMVGDEQDAQDLTQELFIKLYRSLGSFRGAADFATWLRRLTVNLALDYLRARRRHPLQVPLEALADRTDNTGTVEADIVQSEQRRELLAAVQDLPPKYRQTLLLRHCHHLSYAQIAAHIGVPVRTVETRLYRARALLRQALKAAEGDQHCELPQGAATPGGLPGRGTRP